VLQQLLRGSQQLLQSLVLLLRALLLLRAWRRRHQSQVLLPLAPRLPRVLAGHQAAG
jgi:hypothetical protein